MKNKFTFFLILSFVCFMGYSCSDDNEGTGQTDHIGSWAYKNPHFVFDYSSDTIRINAGGREMKWAVEELKNSFAALADENMSDYFKGVEFISKNEVNIKMQFADGQSGELKGIYSMKNNMMELALDTASLSQLTGVTMNIPKISLNHIITPDSMKLYMDKTYIKIMLSMMMDSMLPKLMPSIIPGFNQMPPAAQTKILAAFKQEINGILEQCRTIEIGFNLERIEQ